MNFSEHFHQLVCLNITKLKHDIFPKPFLGESAGPPTHPDFQQEIPWIHSKEWSSLHNNIVQNTIVHNNTGKKKLYMSQAKYNVMAKYTLTKYYLAKYTLT